MHVFFLFRWVSVSFVYEITKQLSWFSIIRFSFQERMLFPCDVWLCEIKKNPFRNEFSVFFREIFLQFAKCLRVIHFRFSLIIFKMIDVVVSFCSNTHPHIHCLTIRCSNFMSTFVLFVFFSNIRPTIINKLSTATKCWIHESITKPINIDYRWYITSSTRWIWHSTTTNPFKNWHWTTILLRMTFDE